MPNNLNSFAPNVQQFIKDGIDSGFVVLDDVLNLYPEPEKHVPELDALFDYLLNKKIDVFENVSTREEQEAQKSTQELEKELESMIKLEKGESLDPI